MNDGICTTKGIHLLNRVDRSHIWLCHNKILTTLWYYYFELELAFFLQMIWYSIVKFGSPFSFTCARLLISLRPFLLSLRISFIGSSVPNTFPRNSMEKCWPAFFLMLILTSYFSASSSLPRSVTKNTHQVWSRTQAWRRKVWFLYEAISGVQFKDVDCSKSSGQSHLRVLTFL